jgi:hypothetical protein
MDVNLRNNWPCPLRNCTIKSKKVCPISLGKLHNGWEPKKLKAFGKVVQRMEQMKLTQFPQGNGMVDETPLSNYPRFKFVDSVPSVQLSQLLNFHSWLNFPKLLRHFKQLSIWRWWILGKRLSGKNRHMKLEPWSFHLKDWS